MHQLLKMKTKFLYFFLFSTMVYTGCKDTVSLPSQPLSDYEKIYMPQAVNNPVKTTLLISDTPQSIIYGANYGGQDYPAADIQIGFAIDPSMVDSFNLKNNTQYQMLPANSYTFTETAATIKRGKLATAPLEIKINTSGANAIEVLTDYLLPVSITDTKMSTGSVKINEDLRTTYYLVRAEPNLADYTNYDRSLWTIAGFSSEEPAEGQWGNGGQAIHTLDDNIYTFWHSQWANALPGPPHYIAVDMGETKTLHGLWFIDRQNDQEGEPKDVVVKVSTDGNTWTQAGAFTLQNTKSEQRQFLNGFKDARYFKVIFNSSYDAVYCHLAELGAF